MTRPAKPKKKPSGPSGKHLHAGVLVRAPDAEREAWARCARRAGETRAAWLRRVANREVRQVEGWTCVLIPDPDEPAGALAGPPNPVDRRILRRAAKKDRAKKG